MKKIAYILISCLCCGCARHSDDDTAFSAVIDAMERETSLNPPEAVTCYVTNRVGEHSLADAIAMSKQLETSLKSEDPKVRIAALRCLSVLGWYHHHSKNSIIADYAYSNLQAVIKFARDIPTNDLSIGLQCHLWQAKMDALMSSDCAETHREAKSTASPMRKEGKEKTPNNECSVRV